MDGDGERPAGTLHEAFFDPVTVGTTVAADGSNGVLKPASFTYANGASATLERIAWEPGAGESGTVTLQVNPATGLTDHEVGFIALDGSIALSLQVADAVVDAANNTLSWTVGSQPWKSGDLLMLRIREGDDATSSLIDGKLVSDDTEVGGEFAMTKAYVLKNSEVVYTKEVMEALRKLEGLVEVHEVLGPYDIVAEVVAENVEAILVILQKDIRGIGGIRNTVTCVTTAYGASKVIC